MNQALQAKLKTLPRTPGVYFHKSASGEVIYVGKAAVLKNRVRQYFQDSRGRDNKTMALVAEIFDTDWIETESEVDALFFGKRDDQAIYAAIQRSVARRQISDVRSD